MTAGVTTPNLTPSNQVDSLIGNRAGTSVQIPIATVSAQLASSGPLSDQLKAAKEGRGAYLTRADLYAVTAPEGVVALVISDAEPGYNGQYRSTGAGWTRFADLDNAEVAAEVMAARDGDPSLNDRLNGLGNAADEAGTLARGVLGRMVAAASLPTLAEAGVVLVFVDRDSGMIAGWFGRDGALHADLSGAPRRMPTPALDYVPLWGAVQDGRFLGFSADGEVIGQINRALSRAGLAPDHRGYGLGWEMVFTGAKGDPIIAHRKSGGLVDFGRARAPVVSTEWLTPEGLRLAPLAVGAVECVVAYFHNGERRVLTPPAEGKHYRAPELAYGGVSVRCWRSDGVNPGELVAVSIERPGFVVDDDPDLVWAIFGDGQSLAQGSHGVGTPWPFREVQWPDHLLTVDNTVLPGDIRTGRNANTAGALIDPATLIGLTPIRPQPGIGATHGLTPIEAMVCQLQDDIVQWIGRPQRIIAWTGGVGGTSITDLGVGTANETNQQTVMAAVVRFAAERGWRTRFAACRWAHGETDAPDASADYAAAVNAYRDALNAYAMGLTGQTRAPVWILAQPSSFAESIDNETTRTSVIGMLDMMTARPADTLVTGPGYADQTGYIADCMHMTNAGYLAQGEADAPILRAAIWGGAQDRPLYAVSAVISGAVITVTWSEPVEIADDMPARPNLGVEVSNGTDSFLTIVSHTLAGATSTITLSAPVAPGDVPNLRVQIGMTGQSYPTRLPENVPTTNIRTVRTAYRAYATGILRHRHALHQRLSVTPV